jgi:regulator of protease activity HflC (stomatin/prohibitin superfamily)
MTSNTWMLTLVAAAAGLVCVPLLARVVRALLVEVPEGQVALITRHGRLEATRSTPGAFLLPSRVLPWVKVETMSLARDFRLFSNVHVNDARGTTLIIDLWVEIRVVDAAKARFDVDDWDQAVQGLVTHAVTSTLGTREFQQILHDRSELGQLVQREVNEEAGRWGVSVERTFIRNIALMPEVERHLVGAVAARLERAKAEVEEHGRTAVAMLEATTSRDIAQLVARARSEYSLAVGRALHALKNRPKVLAAYTQLYEWSLLQGQRVVAFRGFGDERSLRAIDAAMLPAVNRPVIEASARVPSLNGSDGVRTMHASPTHD